jgi:hypothetical protein
MRESWRVKLDRAEEHLQQLEGEIASYAARNPYQVLGGVRTKNHKRVWLYHLHFTEQPDGNRLAVITGDITHNLRSALDHVAVALGSRDGFFPLFTEDPSLDQRVYACDCTQCNPRERWSRAVDRMPKEAVAIIKSAQPYNNGTDASLNLLALLNRFDNADKHRKLLRPEVGLGDATFTATARGQVIQGSGGPGFYKDGAEIAGFEDRFVPPLTETEVDVQGHATFEISLHVENPEGYVGTWAFRQAHDYIADLLTDLEPYVGSKD